MSVFLLTVLVSLFLLSANARLTPISGTELETEFGGIIRLEGSHYLIDLPKGKDLNVTFATDEDEPLEFIFQNLPLRREIWTDGRCECRLHVESALNDRSKAAVYVREHPVCEAEYNTLFISSSEVGTTSDERVALGISKYQLTLNGVAQKEASTCTLGAVHEADGKDVWTITFRRFFDYPSPILVDASKVSIVHYEPDTESAVLPKIAISSIPSTAFVGIVALVVLCCCVLSCVKQHTAPRKEPVMV